MSDADSDLNTESDSIPAVQFESLFQSDRFLLLLVRCALVSVGMALAFGFLFFFWHSERVATNLLQVDEHVWAFSLRFAFHCLFPCICMAILVECQVWTLLQLRLSWPASQLFIPVLVGAIAAVFAFAIFPEEEHGPKETMLVTGGALIGYAAAAFQLMLWRSVMAAPQLSASIPVGWYVGLVLLTSVFMGSFEGWRGPHPVVARLLDYRESRWSDARIEPLDVDPDAEDWQPL